ADLRGTTGDARGAQWVRPELVAQVAFTEWTRGGHLRHPSFLGLREDKPASSVVRDQALPASELRPKSKKSPGVKLKAQNDVPDFVPVAGNKKAGTLAGV